MWEQAELCLLLSAAQSWQDRSREGKMAPGPAFLGLGLESEPLERADSMCVRGSFEVGPTRDHTCVQLVPESEP